MGAAGQLGDIFLGVTPSPVRAYMRKAFASLLGKYECVVIPCAGRFTVTEAAIDAGWKPEQIECSDVSLFSSVLGYAAARRDLADLGVKFHDELEPLTPYLRDKFAGTVLFAQKVCQLNADQYFTKQVLQELWRHPSKYIDEMQGKVDALATKLKGSRYEIVDVREHVSRYQHDGKAILYVNPPGFAKGYAKMFNTRGRITWNDPQIPEFDGKTGRLDLYRLLMDAPPLTFFFRSKAPEGGYGHHAVFSVEKGIGADYVLCSRPAEVPLMVKARKVTEIKPGKIPLLPSDHEITQASRVGFIEIRKEVALYYRDLFAHKLGVTRAERYYLATIDGYMMAVFGLFFANSSDKWKAYARGEVVYETFGFTAPSPRYPRLNHLFMASLVSETARKYFSDAAYGSLQEFKVFQTTCISTTPEQKSHRATGLKLIEKRTRPDGRFHLVYAGPFRKEDNAATVTRWLRMMANVEIETGKPMGVTMIPPKAIQTKAA